MMKALVSMDIGHIAEEADGTEQRGPGHRAQAVWSEKSGRDELHGRNEEHGEAIHMEEPQFHSDKPRKQKRLLWQGRVFTCQVALLS